MEHYQANPSGRVTEYTEEKHEKIVSGIRKNLPYEVAAWGARICEKTLYNWINQGKADKEAGKDSAFVQLLQDIQNAEQEKIAEHLACIESDPNASKGRLWILERRWRKFFGQDSVFYHDLLERAAKIEEAFKRLMENKLHGAQLNGKEMDSESN